MRFIRLISGLILAMVILSVATAQASEPRYKAVAFDYFVIFDPNSVVSEVEKVFPGKGMEVTKAWRTKIFEYSFLRSITRAHEDFFKVTEDAMLYTLASMKLEASKEQKQALLNAFLALKPWPDAVESLKKLKASGVKLIALSNLSSMMLKSNAAHAGIIELFDALVSTEINGTYKPQPEAYALGIQHLGLKKEEIVFAAFGGWDAYGAKSFGYPTYWVNRFNLPTERLGTQADATSNNFQGLLDFVLSAGNGAKKE